MAGLRFLPLAEGQLEIMEIVWARGEVTVAAVWRELSKRRKIARNTVQTSLQRLADQGWLLSRTDSFAHRYRTASPRSTTMKKMLQQFVNVVFAGSAEGLVAALLHERKVTPDEASRIRAMIDKAEGKRP
jgi:BlaI family transcriptional regulator, penicillinase repressor